MKETFNIYFGLIGRTLPVKYKFTKTCNKGEAEALKIAKECAMSLYYKNEGKFGIPTFDKVSEEAELTGLPIEVLYEDHINDMTRYYVIPTELDTVSYKKLRW